MSELPHETREHPITRICVWTAIFATTAAFWTVVGMAILAWLHIG